MKKLFLLIAVCSLVFFASSCKKVKDCKCTQTTTINGVVDDFFTTTVDYKTNGKDQKKCSDLETTYTTQIPDMDLESGEISTVDHVTKLVCSEK